MNIAKDFAFRWIIRPSSQMTKADIEHIACKRLEHPGKNGETIVNYAVLQKRSLGQDDWTDMLNDNFNSY